MTDFARKVAGVLELMQGSHFAPNRSGEPIRSADRKTLLHLINQERRRRHARGLMYEPGLSVCLKNPEAAPADFLVDLTSAIGLGDLGFDKSIWLRPYNLVIDLVRTAMAGGVLRTILDNDPWESLFLLHPGKQLGWKRQEDPDEPDERLFDAVPEFTVGAGEEIAASANMPFEGYLRVCTSMEQHFFGMHNLLRIPTTILPQGEAVFGSAETRSAVARTVVYAFASKAPHIFKDWPADDLRKSQITHGAFLHLVRQFFDLPASDRRSSVQSFLTKAAPQSLQ